MAENNLHKIIQEAGFARVYNSLAETRFALISAEAPGMSPQANADRTGELRARIKDLGDDFMPGSMVFREAKDDSVFIRGAKKSEALALAIEFAQEDFYWAENGAYSLINTKTGEAKAQGLVKDRFEFVKEAEGGPETAPIVSGEIQFFPNFDAGNPAKMGGMKIKKHAFTLGGRPYDLNRPGTPFFFWNGLTQFAYLVRHYGYAVHDDVPGPILKCGDGREMTISGLALYLRFEAK
ncbi:MAG: hypothetical protein HY547_01150 [Elusimicrobia bacterium]|nr:hypothetical protein [Elusimicrobiota bacterium]